MNRVQGLYIISVAAQILQMHPQTLRKYERAGFVEPPRMGTLRLYSEEDIARLRLIKHLVDDLGLNLSGVELALELTTRLVALRASWRPREAKTPPALRRWRGSMGCCAGWDSESRRSPGQNPRSGTSRRRRGGEAASASDR